MPKGLTENKMAPPKRKTTKNQKHLPDEKKKSIYNGNINTIQSSEHRQMLQILHNANQNESFHQKYKRELTKIYNMVEHKWFVNVLERELQRSFSMSDLKEMKLVQQFIAKFVATISNSVSVNHSEDAVTVATAEHPLLLDIFDFLLDTTSDKSFIRFNLCEFTNVLLECLGIEAMLGDEICNKIIKYMTDQLQDNAATVRMQAVYALQRLQVPNDPNDSVIQSFLFHLSHDPSAVVRKAICNKIARTQQTIPLILERLWDIDETVRRNVYICMSGYPVRAYKIKQRLMILEQGLNDSSDKVQMVLSNILLPEWLHAYGNDCVALISALKLCDSDEGINRFLNIAKKTLFAIFKKKNDLNDLINAHNALKRDNYKYEGCVPIEVLKLELSIYWFALIEYLEQHNLNDELSEVICDLVIFCDYLEEYYKYVLQLDSSDEDLLNQHKQIFLILLDIMLKFEFEDETNRQRLKRFFQDFLIRNSNIDELIIQKLLKSIAVLFSNETDRMYFVVDIIQRINPILTINDNTQNPVICNYFKKIRDSNMQMKFMRMRVEVLSIREEEMTARERGQYEEANAIAKQRHKNNCDFIKTLSNYIEANEDIDSAEISDVQETLRTIEAGYRTFDECILRSLQICFFALTTKGLTSIPETMIKSYMELLQAEMLSSNFTIRHWALKCGISMSMGYKPLAIKVYNELFAQFYQHQNDSIWTTVINGVCEMFALHGIEHFSQDDDSNEDIDTDDSEPIQFKTDKEKFTEKSEMVQAILHILDACDESKTTLRHAALIGLGRLVLSGHYTLDILTRIFLAYFKSQTSDLTKQHLGVFFNTITQKRSFNRPLKMALMATLYIVFNKGNEEEYVPPDIIWNFLLNIVPNCNAVADLALDEMRAKLDEIEFLKLISSKLALLDISKNLTVSSAIISKIDNLVDEIKDKKTINNLTKLKTKLHKTQSSRPPAISNLLVANSENVKGAGDDDDDEGDDESLADTQSHGSASEVGDSYNVSTVDDAVWSASKLSINTSMSTFHPLRRSLSRTVNTQRQ